MPPILDPIGSKVDGLAFIGLSLCRWSERGHQDSLTHQTAFDLNEIMDRNYEYVFSTNDDGWLAGGGEPGPPNSYKLASPDSAHVEIIRLGTYRQEWGGYGTVNQVVDLLRSGKILIPMIEVVPTAVVANPDLPPELEIRFDMEPPLTGISIRQMMEDSSIPLPTNWQLRFLHNQFFETMQFPSRFCPGAFHSTILRKAEFRSAEHREGYFAMCQQVIEKWKQAGAKSLIPIAIESTIQRVLCAEPCDSAEAQPNPPEPHNDNKDLSTKIDDSQIVEAAEASTIVDQESRQHSDKKEVYDNIIDAIEYDADKKTGQSKMFGESIYDLIQRVGACLDPSPDLNFEHEQVKDICDQDGKSSEAGKNSQTEAQLSSGLWLFTDRNNITHWIQPNFLPPYDTPDKRAIILKTLSREWDEKSLKWRDLRQDAPL